MTLREQLLTIADCYAAARRLSRARVSTLVFNHGLRLERIAGGSDLTTGSFEAAIAWFSAHWPADTLWPAGIDRPPVDDSPLSAAVADLRSIMAAPPERAGKASSGTLLSIGPAATDGDDTMRPAGGAPAVDPGTEAGVTGVLSEHAAAAPAGFDMESQAKPFEGNGAHPAAEGPAGVSGEGSRLAGGRTPDGRGRAEAPQGAPASSAPISLEAEAAE